MQQYRTAGLKLTPQRIAVMEYLEGNRSHPSAENIYEFVKKKHPTMSFATVYKIIEALKEKGNIVELTIDPERRRYDPDTTPHHHLICIKCKKIHDVRGDFDVNVPDNQDDNFQVLSNHIEFYGICSVCRPR